jgi:alanine racemase
MMNPVHPVESAEADVAINDRLCEDDPDEAALDDDELRLVRILDLQREALRKEDSLEACLGAHNSGLLRIGLRYEEAIQKALDAAKGNLHQILQVQPAMNTHLSISRQVDRFANLEARLAELRLQAEYDKSQAKSAALQRSTKSVTRRNGF